MELQFEFELWLFGDRRQGGRSERSERRSLCYGLSCGCLETVGKSASVASGGDGPLLCVRVCACVRAHIGARKIVSKILKMRHYRSLPIGNRTAVLLYCLFYLPKISVVYCH